VESASSGVESATSGVESASSGVESAISSSESATSGVESATSGVESVSSGIESTTTLAGDGTTSTTGTAFASSKETSISGTSASTSSETSASTSSQCSITPQCTDLDFTYHSKITDFPLADIVISNVKWTGGNNYDVTIKFTSSEKTMSLNSLSELKIIGNIQKVLFSRNSNIALISNPDSWETTVSLTLVPDADGNVVTPSFQIQYDWCTAGVTDQSECASWTYARSYDYMTGCNDYDEDSSTSKTDAPSYGWPAECYNYNNGGREDGSTSAVSQDITTTGAESTNSQSSTILLSRDHTSSTSRPASTVTSGVESATSGTESASSGAESVSSGIESTTTLAGDGTTSTT
ncbi:uncharacterized protein CYBJADRAFT_175273, partial [Cyberlindnera jadinii NRRL Y-1542]